MTSPLSLIGEEAALRAYCFHGGCGVLETNCARLGKCQATSFDEADRLPLRAAISAHLAALKEAGWVCVPEEPTEAMIGWAMQRDAMAESWRYMVSLASSPPAQNGDEVKE